MENAVTQNNANSEVEKTMEHLRHGYNRGGAYGPGGYCVCLKCGTKIQHTKGIKCTTLKCPECGHTLIRDELIRKKTATDA